MSDDKLLELHLLRSKLEQLEADPAVQESLSKARRLEALASENNLTTHAVFSLLVPHLNGTKTSVRIPDYRRLPTKRETKLALHRDLRLLMQKTAQVLERLEEDPDVQKRLKLLDEVAKLDLTPDQAAQLLDPNRYSKSLQSLVAERRVKQGKASGQQKAREKRYWRNPYTGQIVSGYASNMSRLHQWRDEHGDVVDQWEISEEEAFEGK